MTVKSGIHYQNDTRTVLAKDTVMVRLTRPGVSQAQKTSETMNRIVSSEPTFTFTGRPLDKEAALQSNQLRHFDPSVGRWVSEEPVGYDAGDADLHRYVGNRPE